MNNDKTVLRNSMEYGEKTERRCGMSFPYKDNTNNHGECLCKTCLYCSRYVNVFYGNAMAECKKFKDIYVNVGVCKDYVEKRL